jgi:hypothetical protein
MAEKSTFNDLGLLDKPVSGYKHFETFNTNNPVTVAV